MNNESLPRIECRDGCWEFLYDGEPLLLLAGELRNSSSSDPAYMETVWPRMKAMNLNTVIATVSWELVEPQQGHFDFTSVEYLLSGARRHGLKLILIWFGSWKNGMSTYAPAWVKKDTARFFRCKDEHGRISRTISPLCDACVDADAAAFARMMAYLKEHDGQERTVIAVQVENEVGLYGSAKDFSDAAQATFAGSIPEGLAQGMGWPNGSWHDLPGDMAVEAFMSWAFAQAVGRVTAAGKAAYPLPMFVNAWTKQYPDEPMGFFPSGGPIAEMLDVWRLAAPAIDAFGADVYQLNVREEFSRYTHGGQSPLMLPELRFDRWAAPLLLYAVGCGALLASVFAIDDLGARQAAIPGAVVQGVFDTFSAHDPTQAITDLYAELRGMAPLLLKARREGRVQCLIQEARIIEGISVGGYHLRVTYTHAPEAMRCPGALLIIDEGDGQALLMGFGVRVDLDPRRQPYVDILSLDEGTFREGAWRRLRRLNGDEQHIVFSEKLSVMRCAFYEVN